MSWYLEIIENMLLGLSLFLIFIGAISLIVGWKRILWGIAIGGIYAFGVCFWAFAYCYDFTTNRYWKTLLLHYISSIAGLILIIIAIPLGIIGDLWIGFYLCVFACIFSGVGLVTSIYLCWENTPEYVSHRVE